MKNLFIFSSVGSNLSFDYKNEVFESWNMNGYDTGCVIFNNDNFNYSKYFKTILFNQNFKFINFFLYINQYANILNNYEYFAIVDDDLKFNQKNTYGKTYKIIKKYNIDICSISNYNSNKYSYSIMLGHPKLNELWITNFCEMGFMIISSNFIQTILYEYNLLDYKILDYGFDWFICNLASQSSKKIGIIKNITFTNPKSTRTNISWYNWKTNPNILLKKIDPKIHKKYKC